MFAGDSFTVVIIKANYSPLLSNCGYMCRQANGVSICQFCFNKCKPAKRFYEKMNYYFLCILRGQLNSLQEASGGKRISINDLVIKVSNSLGTVNFIARPVFKVVSNTHFF